jgi:acetylglutamate synthase
LDAAAAATRSAVWVLLLLLLLRQVTTLLGKKEDKEQQQQPPSAEQLQQLREQVSAQGNAVKEAKTVRNTSSSSSCLEGCIAAAFCSLLMQLLQHVPKPGLALVCGYCNCSQQQLHVLAWLSSVLEQQAAYTHSNFCACLARHLAGKRSDAPFLLYVASTAPQAAAADKSDAGLAAASKAAVDQLLALKKQLAEAEEA